MTSSIAVTPKSKQSADGILAIAWKLSTAPEGLHPEALLDWVIQELGTISFWDLRAALDILNYTETVIDAEQASDGWKAGAA